jgi:hypothetical protein
VSNALIGQGFQHDLGAGHFLQHFNGPCGATVLKSGRS